MGEHRASPPRQAIVRSGMRNHLRALVATATFFSGHEVSGPFRDPERNAALRPRLVRAIMSRTPLALTPGSRFGPYEIISPIGAGGMGEVYRARDSRLMRDAAIKVLPPAFTDYRERLERFEREAQLLARLHHPNIASVFGLEESTGVLALVMELVEGEDLSTRMARGPIPLDEALPIATQIAAALEVAHEHGIIHRDLKPANVKVRTDGAVKVLDFGLAKALAPDASASADVNVAHSPTLTVGDTRVGTILGTAAYMAPEQARGGRLIAGPTSGPSASSSTRC